MAGKSSAHSPNGQRLGKRKPTFNRLSKNTRRWSHRGVQQEDDYSEEVGEEANEEDDIYSLDILSSGEYALMPDPGYRHFGSAKSAARSSNGIVQKYGRNVRDFRPLYNKVALTHRSTYPTTPVSSPLNDALPEYAVKDEEATDDGLAMPVLGTTLEHENQTMSLRSSQYHSSVVKAESNDDMDMRHEQVATKEEASEHPNQTTVWEHVEFKQDPASEGINEAQRDVVKEEAELIEKNSTQLRRRLREENLQ